MRRGPSALALVVGALFLSGDIRNEVVRVAVMTVRLQSLITERPGIVQ